MRKIDFYRTASGRRPVEEFLDSLSDKKTEKVLWVLRLVKELDPVPKEIALAETRKRDYFNRRK